MNCVCVCRSQHEEIELVSVDEFFKDAPAEISRPHLTKDDSHQLTLARLDWELEQRKRWKKRKEVTHRTRTCNFPPHGLSAHAMHSAEGLRN